MELVTYQVVDQDGSGVSGTISYDPERKKVTVDLEVSTAKKKEILAFFTNKRVFLIPESDQKDDFREEEVPPITSPDHFDMAMSELYGATGIYVVW